LATVVGFSAKIDGNYQQLVFHHVVFVGVLRIPYFGIPHQKFFQSSRLHKVLAMDHEAALGLHCWIPQGKKPCFGWWKIADTLKTLGMLSIATAFSCIPSS